MDTYILGFSIGNPYFNEEHILWLFKQLENVQGKKYIFIPYESGIWTYKGLGYDDKESKRKAILRGNALRNKVLRQLKFISRKSDFHLVSWEQEIIESEFYMKELKRLKKLYENTTSFREDCNTLTQSVLIKQKKSSQLNIDLGKNYVLEELAFLEAFNQIYRIKKSTYVYHNPWKIYESLISGKYDGMVRKNQAILNIKAPD